ncbi:MAG TPA: carbamoyltransferase [Ferruginibacter sp.]|nr:hypothetical protein [Chitinophagaceae bacterium]HRI24069.1 carbamoyltransferase [Ferruginibacter sp.]
MATFILGISAYYHDSAAAIVCDGEIIAAAHEERFTRKKHDASFPENAVRYVLQEAGIEFNDLAAIAFYDKPFIKFERLIETYHAFAPKGLTSFLSSVPVWIKEKLFMKKMLRDEFKKFSDKKIPVLFPEHHLSHAASAYYPSPFNDAAILTIDGVGEWATTTIGHGTGNEIKMVEELHFPHSLGLLYSAFTYYTGFTVNSGEYKLMGLAPYGNPDSAQTKEFKKKTLETLVDVREDGSILLNMKYFNYATGLKMTNNAKWTELFGLPPRNPESEISQDYMNMALAIQQITEEIVIKLAETAKKLTNSDNLVMAGGVALNCVANGKLIEKGIFKNIWIQPASGDAGGALGAAYCGWYMWKNEKRTVNPAVADEMKGAYLGPEYNDAQIMGMVRKYGGKYTYYQDFNELTKVVALKLKEGNVVGWFQGRMEYGPRALGGRSILGDARNPEMQKKMNLKIKYREGFRPFAPSVLEEDVNEYFKLQGTSPYMLVVMPVQDKHIKPLPANYNDMEMYERLYHLRSDIPAITHVDYSARIQTVSKKTNPRYWNLINEFKNQTGYGLLVNSSFNVRGEPIVCTPDDAFRCFMRTEMDVLVVGNFVFDKADQKELENDTNWKEEFKLD